ncbi:MAG: hypothetical protein M0Z95_15345 [Actinomycetota bacterium]|nr:hypothetical protein [Actinomycetota bacterium]
MGAIEESKEDAIGTAPEGVTPPHGDTHPAVATPPDDVAAPADKGRQPPPRHLWKDGIVAAIYVALAVAVFKDVWFAHPSNTMNLGGDQYNFVWFFEWVTWAIVHGHNPFYSSYLNYPYGVNLLSNAGVTGLGLLFTPVTLAFGPIAAFVTAETAAIALSALAGYIFVRRWVRWRPAAFAGGLLFGFSPYELAQSAAGHIHLTFLAFPPLILLALHDLVVRQRSSPRKVGITLGLLCVAQFFISTEILFDTVLIGGIAVIATALLGYRSIGEKARFALLGALWSAGVAAILLAYPLWFMLAGPAHISGKIQLVPQAYRADLLGPVIPDANLWLTTHHLSNIAGHFANSTAENGSYLGVVVMLTLLVATIVLWRRNEVKVAAIAGVAAFVLSLGSGLVVDGAPPAAVSGFPLPGRILADLPLFDNGIPARFSLFCALFAALIVAVTLGELHEKVIGWRPNARGLAAAAPAVLAVLCFLPLVPAPFQGIGATGVPVFFTSSALEKIPVGSTAVIYPMGSSMTPNADLWQAVARDRFRQPGGTVLVPASSGKTVAFDPQIGYERATLTANTLVSVNQGTIPPETPALMAALRRQFGEWHVRTFLAFPIGTPNATQAIQFFTWLLGRPPVVTTNGTFAWYNLQF